MRVKVPPAAMPAGQQQSSQRAVHRPGTSQLASPEVLEWATGDGRPLHDATRLSFEQNFGFDFSGVRIHDDGAAHRAASALGARAFTVGPHISFAAGQHDPATDAGRHLLAHELAHVVQQRSISASVSDFTVLPSDHASEQQAQHAARTVTAGGLAPLLTPAPDAVVQRDVINDASGTPVSYEFRVGTELNEAFVKLAQKLLGGGTLHARATPRGSAALCVPRCRRGPQHGSRPQRDRVANAR